MIAVGLSVSIAVRKLPIGCMVMRVAQLVAAEARAALHHEAAGIDQPVAPQRLGLRKPVGHHGRHDEVGDPGRGFARAEEQHPLVGELAAGDAQRGENAGERHRRGALDVVVEDAGVVAIFVQQAEGRVIGEILELDQHAGKSRARRGHELVDELVIGRAGQALLAKADVIGVVEKLLVVGADVEHDRQAKLGMNAGAGGIERELADRDAHAVGAEVAEPEDALAVGHDDQLGAIGPVARGFRRCGRGRSRR